MDDMDWLDAEEDDDEAAIYADDLDALSLPAVDLDPDSLHGWAPQGRRRAHHAGAR